MNQLLVMDGWLANFLNDNVVPFVLSVLSFIPKMLYFIVACLISIVDLFQVLFRKLAGLDPVILNGEPMTGDSVYQIIMDALFNGAYPAIGTIFWSLIILGVFMLIVTALIATIRIEYNPDKDKGNSKAGIIKNFLTGLFSLLIVPVASIFAMYLTNSLVQVIDTITVNATVDNSYYTQYFDEWTKDNMQSENIKDSQLKNSIANSYMSYDVFGVNIPTTQEPFSGIVFKASAYGCNRFRFYGKDFLDQVNNSNTDLGLFKDGKVVEYKDAADIIDTAFAINAKIKDGAGNSLDDDYDYGNNYRAGMLRLFGKYDNLDSFSKYNVEMVWYFYDLWTFNYIVAFVAIVVLGKLYFQFCLMLLARIFEIISMFVFAPIAIGIMPIDNGGALGRWRLHYAARFGLVLVMVFGMNLVSPVISVLNTIKFFGEPIIDYIVMSLIIVAAMSAVSGLINTFSTILFDKASAYGDSLSRSKETISNVQAGIGATLTGAKVVGATTALAGRTIVGAGMMVGRLGYRGVRAIQDGRENREIKAHRDKEKDAVIDDVKFDKTASVDRSDETIDRYFDSKAGQSHIDDIKKRYHLNDKDAKNRIKNDLQSGGAHPFFDESYRQYVQDYEKFRSTKVAQGLHEGSKNYQKAFEKYTSASDDKKAKMQVGGSGLNEAQRREQNNILGIQRQQRIRHERQEELIKNMKKPFKTAKNAIAKTADKAEKAFKPIAGGLTELINLIPGMELRPPKKDKK